MSGILPVPDPTGTKCCDCAVQVGCGCGSGAFMKCRAIAGIANFCGFPEFVPTVPPVFYLRSTVSGGLSTTCSNDGMGCTNPSECSYIATYSGSCFYDSVTCFLNTNGGLTISGSCGCINPAVPYACDVSAGGFNCQTVDISLKETFTENSHTIIAGGGPPPGQCRTGGTQGCIMPVPSSQCVRDNPDTIDQAVFRTTGPNPAWQSPSNGDCFISSSFTTLWDNTGIFAFSKAQVQAGIPGAVHKHTYQVTINLYERATGSSAPYAPYGLIQVTVTPQVDGTAFTPWIDLPLVAGLQIVAFSITSLDIT